MTLRFPPGLLLVPALAAFAIYVPMLPTGFVGDDFGLLHAFDGCDGVSGTLRCVGHMVDSCLAFSDLPIRMLFAVGILALVVTVVYAIVVLAARLTGIISEPGYATTVLLIAGFGALNALGLSVVGAYAWRAFENTKGRPLAIVRRRYTFGKGAQP